eukprot:6851059-Prymnesium_polylepis.2
MAHERARAQRQAGSICTWRVGSRLGGRLVAAGSGGLVVARRDASTPLHCECLSRRGIAMAV